jgi:hypothetical protein
MAERELPRLKQLEDLFDELQGILKNPEVGAELADLGVNVSIAMTLADGLHEYLKGRKARALLELGTATDEIAARMTPADRDTPS